MYTKNEFIKNWPNELDKETYEKQLKTLYEFNNVPRINEIIDLLDSICGNQKFIKFFDDKKVFYDESAKIKYEKIDIYNAALNTFGIIGNLPIHIPIITKRIIELYSINAIFDLIQSSFVYHSNHYLNTSEDKIIKLSQIFYLITFYVEDFDKKENKIVEYDYEYYCNFYKKLNNIYWDSKKSKKLNNAIYNFQSTILIDILNVSLSKVYYQALMYLMGCNALKNGRDRVTCEDVVIGYITYYKIIFTDIRSIIYNTYNEKKWSKKNILNEKTNNTIEEIKINRGTERYLTNNKFVKCWPKKREINMYENSLKKLYGWKNIPRLNELIDVMDSLCGNKHYLNIGKNNSIADDEETFVFNMKKIPIYHGLEDSFGFLSKIPLYLPILTKKLVEFDSIIALFALIQLNFVEFSGHYLKQTQDKSIKLSDILYMITFYLDDFDNTNNEKNEYTYEYYHEFFKKVHNMYWEDDNAKKLDSDLQDFQSDITSMNHLPFKFQRTFSFATLYVMACNAMKNNRENINCEDVVVGYLTCFKILLNNMKPIVHKLYNYEKWLKEDSYL